VLTKNIEKDLLGNRSYLHIKNAVFQLSITLLIPNQRTLHGIFHMYGENQCKYALESYLI
jgi:hypothetical protein